MTRMTGPDCAVMCNLKNTHTHKHTRLIEAGAGGGGGGGRGGEGQGGEGGAGGRGCWTARTMGGSVGNPAR